jgi:hypothetical protein
MAGTPQRIALLAGLLGLAATVQAGTLRTRFTRFVLHDLPVGRWTRVLTKGGGRYALENTSEQNLKVEIQAVKPFLDAGRLRPYEPVPDQAWVRLKPSHLTLAPGETAEVEIEIHVPSDAAWAGRRYEAWIQARTVGGQFRVGLLTKLRFNTVPASAPGERGDDE